MNRKVFSFIFVFASICAVKGNMKTIAIFNMLYIMKIMRNALHKLIFYSLLGDFQDYASFGCYRGDESNFERAQCDNCVYGVSCMCVKVLNVPGRGDVRDCYANPHNSLDHMVGTCFTNNYQGYLTPICYCDTPFCNSASIVTLPFSSIVIIVILAMYNAYKTCS